MPYEGCKGGGFDKSSLIRPPYSRRQIPRPGSFDQSPCLPEVHHSLQVAFRPTQRYESNLTTAWGQPFASTHSTPSYAQWPKSLMSAALLVDRTRARNH